MHLEMAKYQYLNGFQKKIQKDLRKGLLSVLNTYCYVWWVCWSELLWLQINDQNGMIVLITKRALEQVI